MLLGPKDCAGALAVLDLPFLFQSPRQALRVLDGEIGPPSSTSWKRTA